jgi:hypothetical protein
MTAMIRLGMSVLVVAGLAGCGRARQQAEEAVELADRMVTASRERAEKVAPEETRALADSLQVARERAAAGDYPAATALARRVSETTIELVKSLPGKSTEISSAFMAFSAELPGRVERIRTRLSRLSGGGRLPAGLDRARLDALQAETMGWEETWKGAVRDFQQGNLGAAKAVVAELRKKVAEADSLLGLTSAPR